ncbi:MAG: gfo/Idh/MocA family oxidoreductase, partial [Ignavibacteriae bacterium]|nr:gfo/Idh/MocA family oxidoreductase [Ignavibacteriota bacterium]
MNIKFYLLIVVLLMLVSQTSKPELVAAPLKVAIIGLSHSHVHGILGRPDKGDIEIIAIVEPNKDLAQRFSNDYGY